MENKLPKRKHPRLKDFDYSRDGGYFITICTQDRKQILSTITRSSENDLVGRGLAPAVRVQNTLIGQIVEKEIRNIEFRFPRIKIDKYVIMPNHIHLILFIDNNAAGASPRPTIMDAVCAFKSLSTRKCKELGYKGKLFQTSFHDRIIRCRDEYTEICNYIASNPDNWENDELHN